MQKGGEQKTLVRNSTNNSTRTSLSERRKRIEARRTIFQVELKSHRQECSVLSAAQTYERQSARILFSWLLNPGGSLNS
jgi:hypothetical protein